ncbi:MAG: glycine/betaine/sarcosine/D-proline family reductase selenoprotein B [Erysipelotrichales bacterium]|nr:glycine/betaine/sarcosine/D-proline family reductase selenoprotein B [Erysipelotrichales bacterium]
MKVLMIFDQTQAGLGGKESAELPLGGKMMAIGSCNMFERQVKDAGGKIIGTLYCGNQTFMNDPDTVSKKLAAMAKKIKPDVVICGPCFNYGEYGIMAAHTAQVINEHTDIPSFAIMSQECEKAIADYKDKVHILKMPKKGGTGLNQALNQMVMFAKMLVEKQDVNEFVKEHGYL